VLYCAVLCLAMDDELAWLEAAEGQSGQGPGGESLRSRLRAASEMHQHGLLTTEEKAAFKQLVISRDPKFEQELDTMQRKDATPMDRKSSWLNLKNTLRKNSLQVNGLSLSGMDLMGDIDDTNFDDLIDAPLGLDGIDFNEVAVPPLHGGATGQQKKLTSRTSSGSSSGRFRRKASFRTQRGQSGGAATGSGPSNYANPMPQGFGPGAFQGGGGRQQQWHGGQPGVLPPPPPLAMMPGQSQILRQQVSEPGTTKRNAKSKMDFPEGTESASAKEKKNERERRRRLQVSNGFSDLFKLLRMPESTKMEKSTVLNASIQRLKELHETYMSLIEENRQLRLEAQRLGLKT